MNEWQKPEHAQAYLARADRIPQREIGETTLIEELPPTVRRARTGWSIRKTPRS